MRQRSSGFTLIEVLVATVILAVMGIMAYRGVSEARVAVEHTTGHMDRLREVQRGLQVLVADFRSLAPRPVREPLADGYRASLLRDPNNLLQVELSRGGWPNGAALPRGSVQRVHYSLEDGVLKRRHWTVTDPTLSNEAVERNLLKDVRRFEIRYLNSGREWVSQWPPLEMPGDLGFRARPLAVELVIELADYGELKRIIEVAG